MEAIAIRLEAKQFGFLVEEKGSDHVAPALGRFAKIGCSEKDAGCQEMPGYIPPARTSSGNCRASKFTTPSQALFVAPTYRSKGSSIIASLSSFRK